MKILIVDDHPLYLDGLRTILSAEWASVEILQANSAKQALSILERRPYPNCLLTDYRIPDMDGLDLLKALFERGIVLKTAIISGEDNPWIAKAALDLGAGGFIPKTLSKNDLINAVMTILEGREFLTETMRSQVDQLNQREFDSFAANTNALETSMTKRQFEVLKLIAKGHSNKSIAGILNLSPNTVKEHVQNIYKAFDVSSRSQCILKAQNLGLNTL